MLDDGISRALNTQGDVDVATSTAISTPPVGNT